MLSPATRGHATASLYLRGFTITRCIHDRCFELAEKVMRIEIPSYLLALCRPHEQKVTFPSLTYYQQKELGEHNLGNTLGV